jgi:hypothetical protein
MSKLKCRRFERWITTAERFGPDAFISMMRRLSFYLSARRLQIDLARASGEGASGQKRSCVMKLKLIRKLNTKPCDTFPFTVLTTREIRLELGGRLKLKRHAAEAEGQLRAWKCKLRWCVSCPDKPCCIFVLSQTFAKASLDAPLEREAANALCLGC